MNKKDVAPLAATTGKTRSQRTQPTTVQRARLCVIENEQGFILISAAVTATIIAHTEGDCPIGIAEGIPVFWLPAADMDAIVGEASWEGVAQRLGFGLVGIPFGEWAAERLLASMRLTFPTMESVIVESD